eukprot:CAMPEP_0114255474 /NCGR_PEP_ID=MMETSP0058-20121206/17580_1 /TAXON_ID=36894 /ORGANISM="Pyramimonas parkeae, CCMP726" /LENGTH=73 /DNA_ID=CAMNT_0001369859 /DNA_START=279 /DNA_END=500 /DNA_ORIENTATION=+
MTANPHPEDAAHLDPGVETVLRAMVAEKHAVREEDFDCRPPGTTTRAPSRAHALVDVVITTLQRSSVTTTAAM